MNNDTQICVADDPHATNALGKGKGPNNFQVDLGGLIEILSDHLYTEKSVFIRELLQNAVDAITGAELEGILKKGGGEISLEIQPAKDEFGSKQVITIEDNGIGLTEEEIHTFLVTIGRSIKREDLIKQRQGDFIGRFGIGLLSCFMVADEVVLVTRSARTPDAPTIRWTGHTDGTYELEVLDQDLSPGTRVYLTADSDKEGAFDAYRVRELIRKYGQFLPVSISVRGPGVPEQEESLTNRFPWEDRFGTEEVKEAEWIAFAEETTGESVMGVFPVESDEAGLVGMGVVIKKVSGPVPNEGNHLYLKRMLLSDEAVFLLPDNMPFLRVLANATLLKPNAARDAVHDDENLLEEVRVDVREAFRDYVRRLDERNPGRLKKMMAAHSRALLDAALEDEPLLTTLVPHIPVETTLGEMTLGAVREQFDAYRFITDYEDYKRSVPLARAHSVCVVNAGFFQIDHVCRKLTRIFPEEPVVETSSKELREQYSKPVDDSPEARRLLKRVAAALADEDCEIKLVCDGKKNAPCVLELRESAAIRRSQGSENDLGSLDFLDDFGASADSSDKAVFQLNADTRVVRQLLAATDGPRTRRGIRVLYHLALLAARQTPNPRESAAFEDAFTALFGMGEGGAE